MNFLWGPSIQLAIPAQAVSADVPDEDPGVFPPKPPLLTPTDNPSQKDAMFLDFPALKERYKNNPDLYYEHITNSSVMAASLLGWQAKGLNKSILEVMQLQKDGKPRDFDGSDFLGDVERLRKQAEKVQKALKKHIEDMEAKNEANPDPFTKSYLGRKQQLNDVANVYLEQYLSYLKNLETALKKPIIFPQEPDYSRMRDPGAARRKYVADFNTAFENREAILQIMFNKPGDKKLTGTVRYDLRQKEGNGVAEMLNWTNPLDQYWKGKLSLDPNMPRIAKAGTLQFTLTPDGDIQLNSEYQPVGVLSPFNPEKQNETIMPMFSLQSDDTLKAKTLPELYKLLEEETKDKFATDGAGAQITQLIQDLGAMANDPGKLTEAQQLALKKSLRALSFILHSQKEINRGKARRQSGTDYDIEQQVDTRSKELAKYWKEFTTELAVVRKANPTLDKALEEKPEYRIAMMALAPQGQKSAMLEKFLATPQGQSWLSNKETRIDNLNTLLTAFPLNAYYEQDRALFQNVLTQLKPLLNPNGPVQAPAPVSSAAPAVIIPPLDPKNIEKYFLDIPSLKVQYRDKPALFYEHINNGAGMAAGLMGWQGYNMNKAIVAKFSAGNDCRGLTANDCKKFTEEARALRKKAVAIQDALQQHIDSMETADPNDPFKKAYDQRKETLKKVANGYLKQYIQYLDNVTEAIKDPIERPTEPNLKQILGEAKYDGYVKALGFKYNFESNPEQKAQFIELACQDRDPALRNAMNQYNKEKKIYETRRDKLMRLVFNNPDKEGQFLPNVYASLAGRGSHIPELLNWINPDDSNWNELYLKAPFIASHGPIKYNITREGYLDFVRDEKPKGPVSMGLMTPFNPDMNMKGISPIIATEEQLKNMSVDDLVKEFNDGVGKTLSKTGSGAMISRVVQQLGILANSPNFKLTEADIMAIKRSIKSMSHLVYHQKGLYDAKGCKAGGQLDMDSVIKNRSEDVALYWREFSDNFNQVRKAVPQVDQAFNTNINCQTALMALAPQDKKIEMLKTILQGNGWNDRDFWDSYYNVVSAFPLNVYFPEDRDILQQQLDILQKHRFRLEKPNPNDLPGFDFSSAAPRVITDGERYAFRPQPLATRRPQSATDLAGSEAFALAV